MNIHVGQGQAIVRKHCALLCGEPFKFVELKKIVKALRNFMVFIFKVFGPVILSTSKEQAACLVSPKTFPPLQSCTISYNLVQIPENRAYIVIFKALTPSGSGMLRQCSSHILFFCSILM